MRTHTERTAASLREGGEDTAGAERSPSGPERGESARAGPALREPAPTASALPDEAPQGPPRRRFSRTFAKYVLLEMPGWLIAAGVLLLGVERWELSPRLAGALFALWVGKDFVLYPVLRVAYEDVSPDATVGLVGALGTARERLDPSGYVRVGSELWRAELIGSEAAESGDAVRVRAVRGLTLEVERA
jgi:membrane protein implicated in regulation of membrane protease activity